MKTEEEEGDGKRRGGGGSGFANVAGGGGGGGLVGEGGGMGRSGVELRTSRRMGEEKGISPTKKGVCLYKYLLFKNFEECAFGRGVLLYIFTVPL